MNIQSKGSKLNVAQRGGPSLLELNICQYSRHAASGSLQFSGAKLPTETSDLIPDSNPQSSPPVLTTCRWLSWCCYLAGQALKRKKKRNTIGSVDSRNATATQRHETAVPPGMQNEVIDRKPAPLFWGCYTILLGDNGYYAGVFFFFLNGREHEHRSGPRQAQAASLAASFPSPGFSYEMTRELLQHLIHIHQTPN